MLTNGGSRTHLVAVLLLAGASALVFSAGGSMARAAPATYSIDSGHSSVEFSITHFFSRVTGRFTRFEGTIVLDPDQLSAGSVRVVIDTGSIDTANAERDRHLRSADFFDVANHPRMTFESSLVTPEGGGKLTVDGTLTMRGVSMPVTLEAVYLGSGPDLWGGYRSGFEAHTTINRKDFGIIWNETLDNGGLLLGDEVSIRINIEGLRQESLQDDASPTDGEEPSDDAPTAEQDERETAEPIQQ